VWHEHRLFISMGSAACGPVVCASRCGGACRECVIGGEDILSRKEQQGVEGATSSIEDGSRDGDSTWLRDGQLRVYFGCRSNLAAQRCVVNRRVTQLTVRAVATSEGAAARTDEGRV